jgi:hypothetical protein
LVRRASLGGMLPASFQVSNLLEYGGILRILL